MGATKNVDMSATQDKVKIVANVDETANAGASDAAAAETDAQQPVKTKKTRTRSHSYTSARAQVDKTKNYDAFAAIELIKRLSYSSFDGTLEAHGVMKEEGASATFAFPHSTGKTRKVVIASDAVLAEIAEGVFNFDVLVASPDMMPKLTKFARVLGPKGLMPNPKLGTLTPNPEKAKADLEAGSQTVKTEKKAPLIHVAFGKTSMDTKDLVENLQTLMKVFKGKLIKLSISSTMSPGVKVQVEE